MFPQAFLTPVSAQRGLPLPDRSPEPPSSEHVPTSESTASRGCLPVLTECQTP